eukprot:gene11208-276_t
MGSDAVVVVVKRAFRLLSARGRLGKGKKKSSKKGGKKKAKKSSKKKAGSKG